MLSRLSILLAALSAAALLFFLSSVFLPRFVPGDSLAGRVLRVAWGPIPPSLAFHIGAALSLIASALALVNMARDRMSGPSVRILVWCMVELLVFGFFYACAVLRV
jgi:hypothetical protein